MIQICENGHNRIAYDDNDITEHDGCPYCSMYKDMSQYLQEAKKRKPRTHAEAEEMVVRVLVASRVMQKAIDDRKRPERVRELLNDLNSKKAALIAALTGGGE